MADFLVNEGTQTKLAVDTIGGTQFGIVKVDMGAAGLSTPFTGTIPEITNIAGGTINRIQGGSIAITAGTIVSNGGTIAEVTNGSIRMTAGTVNTGTINSATINAATINTGTINAATITGGTLNALANGTITSGSITVTAGTVVNNGGTVAEITNGTLRITAGTITSVTSVASLLAGSINVIAATINTGTINAATINAGTMKDDGRTGRDILSFGTVFGGTGTTAAYATIVSAPGASNYVWVNSISLKNPYGTVEAAIGFGTAVDGGSVLEKGVYGTQTGIGITTNYPKAVNGGITNQPLVLYKSGLGTIYANVTYFTSI